MNTASTTDLHANQLRAAAIYDLVRTVTNTPDEDHEASEDAQNAGTPDSFVPTMHFLRGIIHC